MGPAKQELVSVVDVSLPLRHSLYFDFLVLFQAKTLPDGFFAWIKPVIQTGNDEVFRVAGLDSLMYLLFFRLGLQVAVIGGFLYGVLVLFPVHETGFNEIEDTDGNKTAVSGIEKLSMSNLGAGSSRLWADLISIYIVTGAALYFIRRTYIDVSHSIHSSASVDTPVAKQPTQPSGGDLLFRSTRREKGRASFGP